MGGALQQDPCSGRFPVGYLITREGTFQAETVPRGLVGIKHRLDIFDCDNRVSGGGLLGIMRLR